MELRFGFEDGGTRKLKGILANKIVYNLLGDQLPINSHQIDLDVGNTRERHAHRTAD